ncbi:MAG: hypothetical protein ACTJGD_00185 [Mesonia hippocampi]|uniref:hypothetical protein n=1 Tax=Mesonia hippocampi TaxID=1628250 RepID=UPI003F98E90F
MALYKILKIVSLILGAIGLVLGIWLFTSDNASLVEPMLYITYIVGALLLLLVAVFGLKDILTGDIKKTLITLGAFVVVVAIAYFMSSGVDTVMRNGETLTAGESKWIGAGLRTFYILAIVAILLMIYSSVKKLISK